ncbi:hypothetical protein F5I97DRAFT_1929522 [Phlebopus sp. FC_14]|nr:hypothetical protein F5I97DRAFT_1929522 [Phlebopus sp. FC_14]
MDSPLKDSTLWKGKAKATNQDYDDLRPVITYRHLLSQNLSVRDPLRVVALCDSDAFYAACERVRLGLDPDVPLVVQQWESLIAVSYPARKYGISRMDKVKDAKKKCPDLVSIHVATYKEGDKEPGYWDNVDTSTHKVSLDLYRRESNKVIMMFKEALPTGEIEKASIDEAFIDFTRPVREKLLERYPYLTHVPVDAPAGVDSPLPPAPLINWGQLSALVPIGPQADDDKDEPATLQGDYATTWHDVALSIAAELMTKIREDVHKKLGYTTSAGIARNKFLAKLSASYQKPNSQTVLRNDAIPSFLRPMGFQKIRFLGGKLGQALAKEYDVSTVGDLLTISLDEMQGKFGENAIWVYELLRWVMQPSWSERVQAWKPEASTEQKAGLNMFLIDVLSLTLELVKEKPALFKSMLAAKNLPKPITKPADGYHWIRILAAELALRLNDAREEVPTLWPKTIVLHARKGYETSRSKQATFPFTRDVTVDVIAAAADKLWRELTHNAKSVNVTSVQLAFTGIETAETGQQSIEGYFTSKDSQRSLLKRPRLDNGDSSVEEGEGSGPQAEHAQDPSATSFVCERCHKRIALRQDQFDNDLEQRADAMAALRMEHKDYHFAQDLANGLDKSAPVKPGSSRKQREVERKGIARFFKK